MSTIWVFGDSFSMDFNVTNNKIAKTQIDYVKWKNRYVKNFSNFIAEKYNMSIKNFAQGGLDNYSIFENLCSNIDNIENDDFVFVGWGANTRTRFINPTTQKWYTINGVDCHNELKKFLDIDTTSLVNILSNRDNDLTILEYKNWSKLINKALQNNFVHIWSWTENNLWISHETILQETDNLISDNHWSENGHKNFADDLMRIIDEWKIKKSVFIN